MKIISICIFILTFAFSCTKTPEEIAALTAPIAFAIARNAIDHDFVSGDYIIKLKFTGLKREKNKWPEGQISIMVSPGEHPDKTSRVDYVLNGSSVATAIVSAYGHDKKQFQVNLYDSTIISRQATSLEKHIEILFNRLKLEIKGEQKLAVLDFHGIDGRKIPFGKHISESLVTYFVKNKYKVVERRLLDPVFQEFNFQSSGLTRKNINEKIGKFLGADAVVTGTIKSSKGEIIVNARVIKIDSGLIISAGKVIIPKYLIQMPHTRCLE